MTWGLAHTVVMLTEVSEGQCLMHMIYVLQNEPGLAAPYHLTSYLHS